MTVRSQLLSLPCVSLWQGAALSRFPRKSKEIRESSEETGKVLFFFFAFSPCPFTVLPQSEQSFQRREGAVRNLGGRERRDGSRKRTILETWNSLWTLAQKKEKKKKTHLAPKPKDQIWESSDVFKYRLSLSSNRTGSEREKTVTLCTSAVTKAVGQLWATCLKMECKQVWY